MSGVPWEAEPEEPPQLAPMNPGHPSSCSALAAGALRGTGGPGSTGCGCWKGAEEMGGHGFQPSLERKGREAWS